MQHTFRLHLPGLLKVLAEHLYSNKQVALRELIQNAHDSCTRRAIEENARHWKPRVTLQTDSERGVLTITDNGAGLTEDEVIEYLSTIGRSYTRELREKLSLLTRNEAADLIGQFGFGFLSAFLIAEQVTLITRSIKPDSPAVRWSSRGDEHYELAPAERNEPGTTIELLLKPEASYLLKSRTLIDVVRRFVDFLPLPVHLAGDPFPLNMQQPPWSLPQPTKAISEYIQRNFAIDEPLAIIPLHDHEVTFGDDSATIPLEGFLFIPPSSNISVREYGTVQVYIRRMFIEGDQDQLLPKWARFVQGVIDCPALQPTASREELHQDEMFMAVQAALTAQLRAGLRRIAAEEPTVWRRIVRGHASVITSWASRDLDFFNDVADLVPLHTSRGRQTIPEYIQSTDNSLFYVREHMGSIQDTLLAEGYNVPVIDASLVGVAEFLQRYAETHPEIELTQLDGDLDALLREVDSAPFQSLLEHYAAQGIAARVAAFQPAELPAVMVYPANIDALLETRAALDADELPQGFAGLIGAFMEQRVPDAKILAGTLYLNATCPLTRRMLDVSSELQVALLTIVYQVARLFNGRALTPPKAVQAWSETLGALEILIQPRKEPINE